MSGTEGAEKAQAAEAQTTEAQAAEAQAAEAQAAEAQVPEAQTTKPALQYCLWGGGLPQVYSGDSCGRNHSGDCLNEESCR